MTECSHVRAIEWNTERKDITISHNASGLYASIQAFPKYVSIPNAEPMAGSPFQITTDADQFEFLYDPIRKFTSDLGKNLVKLTSKDFKAEVMKKQPLIVKIKDIDRYHNFERLFGTLQSKNKDIRGEVILSACRDQEYEKKRWVYSDIDIRLTAAEGMSRATIKKFPTLEDFMKTVNKIA